MINGPVYPPVTERIRLSDGRTVRVRDARASDAELFLGFFSGLSAESRDFMHGWSGAGACTREHAESLAAQTRAREHCALVALDRAAARERMVGYCWVDGLGQTAPIPMLGIGLVDEYHEVGLGRSLLRLMIDHARRLGVDRVQLGVWADNPRAIHVYRTVGFRTDPGLAARDFDGRKELYMVVATGAGGR